MHRFEFMTEETRHTLRIDDGSDSPRLDRLLRESGFPSWLVDLYRWDHFIAIGTWECAFGEYPGSAWSIAREVTTGHLYLVVKDISELEDELSANLAMAAASGIDDPDLPYAATFENSVLFLNSSLLHFLDSQREYEGLLRMGFAMRDIWSRMKEIDPPIDAKKGFWFDVMALCLSDEY